MVSFKVEADNSAYIHALVQNITRVFYQLPVEMRESVSENWTQRTEYLRRSRSQHLKEIIQKNK